MATQQETNPLDEALFATAIAADLRKYKDSVQSLVRQARNLHWWAQSAIDRGLRRSERAELNVVRATLGSAQEAHRPRHGKQKLRLTLEELHGHMAARERRRETHRALAVLVPLSRTLTTAVQLAASGEGLLPVERLLATAHNRLLTKLVSYASLPAPLVLEPLEGLLKQVRQVLRATDMKLHLPSAFLKTDPGALETKAPAKSSAEDLAALTEIGFASVLELIAAYRMAVAQPPAPVRSRPKP